MSAALPRLPRLSSLPTQYIHLLFRGYSGGRISGDRIGVRLRLRAKPAHDRSQWLPSGNRLLSCRAAAAARQEPSVERLGLAQTMAAKNPQSGLLPVVEPDRYEAQLQEKLELIKDRFKVFGIPDPEVPPHTSSARRPPSRYSRLEPSPSR